MHANWKTSSFGVVGLAIALASIWAPARMQPKIQATAIAVAASGLLPAKDGDK